jgi:tripartite-type tricarboxylate transporter receptor subunit TctC
MKFEFKTSRRRALKLGLAASLAAPAIVRAQAWPNGPIVFINPFPAGGGTDTFCRPLAAQVGDQLGQQIIVDNKGGAGGTVGASLAAKPKPCTTPSRAPSTSTWITISRSRSSRSP